MNLWSLRIPMRCSPTELWSHTRGVRSIYWVHMSIAPVFAEVMHSNPVEALIFFQASSFQFLKLENLLQWSLFTFSSSSMTCTWGIISKYQNRMPKVARKASNIGKVWNSGCCRSNQDVKLVLWSTFSRMLLQWIKLFLTQIGWDIFTFHQNLVECMTSSLG